METKKAKLSHDGDLEYLLSVQMNEKRFLSLLEKLIGESKYLQNSPAQGLIPQENLASHHVLEVLKPFSVAQGGVLHVERVEFVEGRGNVIITYPGTTDKIVSFVGSHLDVVPANADKGWDRDPFKLFIDGDELYGRGTTDCLGHVAMLTDLMATLAETKPALQTSIIIVFIANEENSTFKGIGVDQLAAEGYMDKLLHGPLFWIDSADTNPCIGTAGNLQWKLDITGKPFHSGLPHKGINAIELGMDLISYIQANFFEKYPKHVRESEYNFATQSTLKPTRMHSLTSSVNQIPGECTIEGDIRLSPFYDVHEVREFITSLIDTVNSNPDILLHALPLTHSHSHKEGSATAGVVDGHTHTHAHGDTHAVSSCTDSSHAAGGGVHNDHDHNHAHSHPHSASDTPAGLHGPHSKYRLPAEALQGHVVLTWLFEGENGVACDLQSPGHKALKQATEDIMGVVVPYGIGGSLPLIRSLKDKGFDVQIAGYGLSNKYHGDNESAKLSHMKNATRIIARIIHGLEALTAATAAAAI